jgi:hypothetical protein
MGDGAAGSIARTRVTSNETQQMGALKPPENSTNNKYS